MPKVSVIIPTYKHANLVTQTLESVFAQTFQDFEVIVVDDGSPDGTANMLWPLVCAGRVRYIEQANAGQAAARNRGLAEAKGEFIAFLDDDDLWPTDKLERQMRLLENNPKAGLVYGSTNIFGFGIDQVYPGSVAPSGNVLQDFLCRNWIGSPGQTLIRTDALQRVGGFDRKIWGADDWDLYIRLARDGEFVYDSNVVLHYRMHDSNASQNILKMYINSCRVARKHMSLVRSGTSEVRWLTGSQYLRGHYFIQTMAALKRQALKGRWDKAFTIFVTAICINPFATFTNVLSAIRTAARRLI